MLRKKTIRLTVAVITFLIGVFLLISFQSNITGAIIGTSASFSSIFNSFLGAMFIALSIVLFATRHSNLEKITLSSAIKKSESLLRLTQNAARNQTVEKELDHLIKELSKGNFEAGLGHPGHISETDVFYLRGRNGARLYYHKTGENSYEIVAKSAKGRNEDQVINKIREVYGN